MTQLKPGFRCFGLEGLLVLALMFSANSWAGSDDRSVLEDAGLYVTAPLRWDQRDWLYAGGSLVAIVAAHRYDDRVREHFASAAGANNNTQDVHSTKDALPALALVAGTGALAVAFNDSDGYHETRDLLEAGVFSAAATWVVKAAVHRERPIGDATSNDWFKRGDSFPSRHVSVAVAIGAVLAESGGDDYRWVRRALGYGVGAAAMYVRLEHQQHWLSDTVAGAALGAATARFVLNRAHPDTQTAWQLLPAQDGVMLSYAKAFR